MNQAISLKKLLILAALALAGMGFLVANVHAQSTATASATVSDDAEITAANQALADSKSETRVEQRILKLKAAGDRLILVRIASLNKLLERVNKVQRIDPTDKNSLVTDINTNISGLTDLKTKIDSDTDLATLKADIHSIFATFRIYWVVLPRDYGLLIAGRESFVVSNLTGLESTIQSRIDTANGKNQYKTPG